MNRARIHDASWGAGYQAGFEGRSVKEPPGVDGLSFWSGYIEGKAKSDERENNRTHSAASDMLYAVAGMESGSVLLTVFQSETASSVELEKEFAKQLADELNRLCQ